MNGESGKIDNKCHCFPDPQSKRCTGPPHFSHCGIFNRSMSTRQLRISDSGQIKQQLGRLVGRKINLVLRDGTAMLGVLKKTDGQEIVLTNMAQSSHRYPISSITEIYIDSHV